MADSSLYTLLFRKKTFWKALTASILTIIKIRSMPDGKDFYQLDSALRFVTASVERAVRKPHLRPMTPVHTNFSNFRHLLNRKNMEHVLALQALNIVQHRTEIFKASLSDTFNPYCGIDRPLDGETSPTWKGCRRPESLRMFGTAEYLRLQTSILFNHIAP